MSFTSAQASVIEALSDVPRPRPPHHVAFTPEQLRERAVLRRDNRRILQKMILASGDAAGAESLFDNKAPHANRGTRQRRHSPRQSGKDTLRRALRKEAEIGINPVYRIHGSHVPAPRNGVEHKAWLAASKAWDRLNPAEAV